MYRKILLAVDDVSQHDTVLALLRGVTGDAGAEVRVLHLRLRELSGWSWHARESLQEAGLITEATVFELRMAGFGAAGEVRYALVGRAAEAIADVARSWGADLVVLGSPKRARLAARFLGSLTGRLLHLAPCPVLIAGRHDPAGRGAGSQLASRSAASTD